jgi:hypothetical protein
MRYNDAEIDERGGTLPPLSRVGVHALSTQVFMWVAIDTSRIGGHADVDAAPAVVSGLQTPVRQVGDDPGRQQGVDKLAQGVGVSVETAVQGETKERSASKSGAGTVPSMPEHLVYSQSN